VLDPAWLRRQIGVVLQENILFNRSVRDNIALADPAMPIERIIVAAQLAGAHEFILELPKGYDTVLGERGSSLSGGQRQRIAIARALVMNPRILIFDEATSALDNQTQSIVSRSLEKLDATRIVIAHRLSTIVNADQIYVFDQGRIIQRGAYEELIGQEGLFRDLAQRQIA
jgi:subfamily B ATP-binding cassette protein HlyB/CyaB